MCEIPVNLYDTGEQKTNFSVFMLILPDTNIFIAYFLRQEPAASLIKEAILEREIRFSVVSVAEFMVKASSRESSVMNKLLDEFGMIAIDREIVNQAVLYRKYIEKKIKKVYLLDCFLAASAKITGATLITYDVDDYPFTDISVKTPGKTL